MAKRRRLSAPDAAALKDLETGFAAKPALETKSMAPIAQVAGEAAALAAAEEQGERIDAARLRAAEQGGLLATQIDLAAIDKDFVARDRLEQDAEAMAELKSSIKTSGQRTPIEVVRTEDGYGLISGWRRLTALRELLVETGDEAFMQIKAFVRDPLDSAQTYLNMIEENEIRANLSHYERGRIAVVAVGQGVYADIEEAVNHLFATASKAKRSKVRSFAAIHEALGDLLRFPTELTEKAGLKLAKAIREGDLKRFRAVLGEKSPMTPAEELRALEEAVSGADAPAPTKGGRPSTRIPLADATPASGGVVKATKVDQGFVIEFQGRAVTKDLVERIQRDVIRALDR